MALSDLDQQLPPGYNVGGFDPSTGSLRWAAQYLPGPLQISRPDARGNFPWNQNTPAPVTFAPQPIQKFNLGSLFNGGPLRAGAQQTPGMFATVKSPGVQKAVDAASATRTGNAMAEQQSLKDYAAQVLGGQPQAKAAADQEVNSINQIYGTGGDSIEARLAALNRQEQAANNIAMQRAAGQARRSYNAARAGGGNSSYLDRLLAQRLYAVNAEGAGRAAQQSRNDLTWLTGQRNASVGRRQNILDTLARRSLDPVFAQQQMEGGALNNLSRLADLDYANNIYERPEDAVRRQLEFLNYLSPYYA